MKLNSFIGGEKQSFDKLKNTHIIDLFKEYEKEIGYKAF